MTTSQVTVRSYGELSRQYIKLARKVMPAIDREAVINATWRAAQYLVSRTPHDTNRLKNAWMASPRAASASGHPGYAGSPAQVTRGKIKSQLGPNPHKASGPGLVNAARQNRQGSSYATRVLLKGHSKQLKAGTLLPGLDRHMARREKAIFWDAIERAKRGAGIR